ncbi:MAG: cyclic 2,3-diphosphoglycerate synthase [Limnochordia bacterium]
MGAAGRDFHNFNVCFRDKEEYEVVAFTATQIPDIEGRKYPAELAGSLYPQGIPIYAESDLEDLIDEYGVHLVVFSYSDVSYETVMSRAAQVNAHGADFMLLGHAATMLKSSKPVVAVCAARTGAGKSQTTRRIASILSDMGKKVVAIRHPMPYGDLAQQVVQRFATHEDLVKHKCTIEEMEEYEPHIDHGVIVYAGVDYEKILRMAEEEADVILWDGGNNDLPFYKPDLHITIVDPHRAGHELRYYPGETNLRMADVVVINKMDTAGMEKNNLTRNNVVAVNPKAVVVDAASPIFVDAPEKIRGKRVLVIEDGPTLTHGEMSYGAGYLAARKYGAREIIHPRDFAVGSIAATYAKYDHMLDILPAMGYGGQQIEDLEETVARIDCDTVIIATPIDLNRVIDIKQDTVRVTYELQELGSPDLQDILKDWLEQIG